MPEHQQLDILCVQTAAPKKRAQQSPNHEVEERKDHAAILPALAQKRGDTNIGALQVARCVGQALAELGGIDVLVNNAGGPIFNAPFLGTREDGWEKVIDLNLTSVLRFCRRVGAHMVERGRGSIVYIASVATSRPWPALTAYSVAKASVVTLTKALAQEWGRDGVRVNAVSPGWIDTTINQAFVESSAAATIADDVPMGRWGETDDVVGIAVWLASDASSYVTGANIPVDGGLSVAVPEDWRALRVERAWTSAGADRLLDRGSRERRSPGRDRAVPHAPE